MCGHLFGGKRILELCERNDAPEPCHTGERLGALPRPFGGVLVRKAFVQPARRAWTERATERDVRELVPERRDRIDDFALASRRYRDHTQIGIRNTDRPGWCAAIFGRHRCERGG